METRFNRYGGENELMTWTISNAVVHRDNKDNIYPMKKRRRGRIDPLIAALLDRKLAMLDRDDDASADDPDLVVASRGVCGRSPQFCTVPGDVYPLTRVITSLMIIR